MAEQEAIGLLEQLARDFNVRDPRKLFQIAFPDRRDLTSARAAAALRGDVARQVLAPKPRSLGKSAAEGPNDRLQADLVDFSQNTRGRNKYGLVVTDVFTREVATKALPDKRAETVTAAAAEIIPDLVQGEGSYVVTTDLGNEFRGLEGALPGGAVHRQKDPTDRNATAVVDRAIQTLKKDLAGMVARRGGGWGEHVDEAAEAYNARPHQAVTVAPEDVEMKPAATFRVYQDNADKSNTTSASRRAGSGASAGIFRAPTNAARSFQPQYGPARNLASYDSIVVRGTDGSETLLKHAPRAAPSPWPGSPRPEPLTVRQFRLQPPQPRLLTEMQADAKRFCNPRPKTTTGEFACLLELSPEWKHRGRQRAFGSRVVRAVLHSGTLRLWRQRSLPLKGFHQPSRLRSCQSLPAKPLSRYDMDFHRSGAEPSHWLASRHPKHDRQAEPRIALGSFTRERIWKTTMPRLRK